MPRRKEGEDPDAPRHIHVSFEALEGLFHLPLRDAALEIGLCPTTLKKACRRFDLEKWPYRQKQGHMPFARRASETEGVHADVRTLHQEPVCASTAPTLQSTGVHQANHAVSVSCTSPVWQDGGFSSATPQGLVQQDSMAFDTRSYGQARHARPAFEHKTFAPLDAPSYIDTLTRGSVVIPVTCPCPAWSDTSSIGVPLPSITSCSSDVGASPEPHRDCATPLKTGPPQERSCVEAVMDYLDLGCSFSEAELEFILSDDCSF